MQDKLRTLLADRRFLPRGTACAPCSHLYHQDARFQRQQRPLSAQTVSALKAGLPRRRGRTGRGVGGHLLPLPDRGLRRRDLAARALSHSARAVGVGRAAGLDRPRGGAGHPSRLRGGGETLVSPGWNHPHFNGQPTMYPGAGGEQDPDPGQIFRLWRTCMRASTAPPAISGTKAATLTSTPTGRCMWRSRRMARVRAVGKVEAPQVPALAPRKRSARKDRG